MSTPRHREALLALFTVVKKQDALGGWHPPLIADLRATMAGASAALALTDKHAPTLGQRARFEAWVQDRYLCTENSFERSDYSYAHTVPHRALRGTYASVQMLWEAWQGASVQLPAFTEAELRGIIERECGPVQKMGDMLWAEEVARAVLAVAKEQMR